MKKQKFFKNSNRDLAETYVELKDGVITAEIGNPLHIEALQWAKLAANKKYIRAVRENNYDVFDPDYIKRRKRKRGVS